MRAVLTLGAIPGGRALIDLMADMNPAEQLRFEAAGLIFPSRVGLGCGISETALDLRAFDRFGFGYLELGPITAQPVLDSGPYGPAEKTAGPRRQDAQLSIADIDLPRNAGLDYFLKHQLPQHPPSRPLLVRVAHIQLTPPETAIQEMAHIVAALPAWIGAVVVDTRWCLNQFSEDELNNYLKSAVISCKTVILTIAADEDDEAISRMVRCATACGVKGISVTGGIKSDTGLRVYGRPTKDRSLDLVRQVKSMAPSLLVIGSGGIIEPADALAMREAGADVVSLYSGLIYSGPGLPKRINELMTTLTQPMTQPMTPTDKPASRAPYSLSSVMNAGWLGIALVGIGLIITGASAITVALTTVILPYDENFLGITREALIQINPRLLPFLSHDRVTYAGAGMSCGLLFFSLIYFGGRFGQKWAYGAAALSCAAGFASFLLFLAYRFLDPLHALATLLLVPPYVWGLMRPPQWRPMRASNLYNSRAWRHSLVGQFLFVCIGAGLLLAGCAICFVGSTTVFVAEDLDFMKTTAHHLLSHNEHLLPEIAHDRAGFGGTLVTAGIAVLLTAFRGFRQGEGWVWWMLLIAGLPGYLCTLGIHFAIGYMHFSHLFPAYIATLMFIVGLAMSYKYLCVEPAPDQLLAERTSNPTAPA